MACNNNGGQRLNIEIISNKLHRANHENIKKFCRTLENTIGYQSDPVGHVINLSKKTSTAGAFQLLNKNPNFIPTL